MNLLGNAKHGTVLVKVLGSVYISVLSQRNDTSSKLSFQTGI